MIKIVVFKTIDDFLACPENEPQHWGRGKTPSEAIGDCIRSNQERIGIEVKFDFPVK